VRLIRSLSGRLSNVAEIDFGAAMSSVFEDFRGTIHGACDTDH
jgi:hypothetical protein